MKFHFLPLPQDQPLAYDTSGVLRFRPNRLVMWLVEHAERTGLSLNDLAARAQTEGVTNADECQLAQLLGYSVQGYLDLSYVDDEHVDRVLAAEAREMLAVELDLENQGES